MARNRTCQSLTSMGFYTGLRVWIVAMYGALNDAVSATVRVVQVMICASPVTGQASLSSRVTGLSRRITIEELAKGMWTESGDAIGATWEELLIISMAKQILEHGIDADEYFSLRDLEIGVAKRVVAEKEKYKKKIRDVSVDWNSTAFVVTDYQRSGTHNHEISREAVMNLWDCLMEQPANKRVTSGTVYESFCRKMNWRDFFDDKDNFDKAKFRGARDKKTGSKYFIWYYAMKVIQFYGLIEYKSHWVTRIADEFRTKRVPDSKLDDFGE